MHKCNTIATNMEVEATCLLYVQTPNISRTKSNHLSISRLVLQLCLPNTLKPGNKSRMKMQLEQRQQFYCPLR